jgi:hypothetical protein
VATRRCRRGDVLEQIVKEDVAPASASKILAVTPEAEMKDLTVENVLNRLDGRDHVTVIGQQDRHVIVPTHSQSHQITDNLGVYTSLGPVPQRMALRASPVHMVPLKNLYGVTMLLIERAP